MPFADGDDWLLVRPKRALVKSPLYNRGAIWKWSADFADGQTQIEWLSQPLSSLQPWLDTHRDWELAQARALAPLDEEARSWAPFFGDVGAHASWQKLFPALQTLCASSNSEDEFTWELSAAACVGPTPHFHSARLDIPRPAGALLEWLQERYLLVYDVKWQRALGRKGYPKRHAPARFSVQGASQHEKMEAALLWRDFGREIGKSEEVEAALRDLMP